MMKRLLLPILCAVASLSYGQTVYNLNNQDLNFGGTGVTITAKVGTGTSVGDVVLYENVVTIGSQQIDAIIRTVSLTGTMTDHDNPSTSGFGMSNNEARFFSPQFSFTTGGGMCMFRFEFIEGGSYNNTTDSGTFVALTKVLANTYDIDGNGGTNSNQFNEFGGFDTVSLGNPTNVTPTYNFATNLTKFRSNSNSNVFNVLDDRTRVLVGFPLLSSFDIAVGADGSGAAYFFIDFGSGATWGSTPNVFYPPELDLDTLTSGTGHLDTFCNAPTYFSGGGTNITSSNGDLAALRIQFTTAEIMDGANEKLVIGGATAGDSIALNFTNGALIPNISFAGNTYSVTAEVSNGESSLTIQPSGGGMMLVSEAEQILDSLMYYNSVGTSGERIFDTYLIDDAFASIIESYTVNVNCGILPVELLYNHVQLEENGMVSILWATVAEYNSSHYVIERSSDLEEWEFLDHVDANGNSNELNHYQSIDPKPSAGISYYRITQFDYSGDMVFFDPKAIELQLGLSNELRVFVDPISQMVYLRGSKTQLDDLSISSALGQDLSIQGWNRTSNNTAELSMTSLPKGMLFVRSGAFGQTILNP